MTLDPRMTPQEYQARQARRRRLGKVIPCVVNARWVPFPVTTEYGRTSPIGKPWSLGRHTGEDHAAPVGSRVVSVSWGRVVCVANWTRPNVIGSRGLIEHWGDSYGTHIVIRLGTGRYDVGYCHLSETRVRPGQWVRPGQVIGLSGQTGGSGTFGPHLHLEARPAGGRFGTDVNPINVKRIRREP